MDYTQQCYVELILKIIVIVVICILLIIATNHFARIESRSQMINELNQELEEKNNCLRKIKHDYGAQISYLYGLCLLNRWTDLGKSINDIYNKNRLVASGASVKNNSESIIYKAIKPVLDDGIHVILKEYIDEDLIRINIKDLATIIMNIGSNASEAIDGSGIIIIEVYEMLGNAVIKIRNSGPKIEEEYLENILNNNVADMNENKKSGLKIIKELVKKNNGEIFIKSTEVATEFKFVFEIKAKYKV